MCFWFLLPRSIHCERVWWGVVGILLPGVGWGVCAPLLPPHPYLDTLLGGFPVTGDLQYVLVARSCRFCPLLEFGEIQEGWV